MSIIHNHSHSNDSERLMQAYPVESADPVA
jgi:hypothetical protein